MSFFQSDNLFLYLISRQIIIHDTSPQLFQIFLEYLYGGQVDTGQLMTDQLASLMQLSDRYEVRK